MEEKKTHKKKTSHQKSHKERKRVVSKAKARRIKRRKIHSAIFYSIYGVVIAAALIATAIVMRDLRDYATAYEAAFEAAKPQYAVEKASKVFADLDYAAMYAYEDTAVYENNGETMEQYIGAMERFVNGREITWTERRSGEEGRKTYIVKAGDEQMGEFSIKQTGEEDEFGNKLWDFDTLSTCVIEPETYTVTAPSKSTVYVDGQALTSDEIIESGIALFDTVELPEDTVVPTACTYQFSRYFGVNNVRVVDAYGIENEVTQDGNAYTAAFNYDDSRLDETEEWVIKVVRRLSCFMTGDYSSSSLRHDCVIEKSPAEVYIKAFDDAWIASHKGYDFLNMDVSNYVSYSGDCFSVETRYDYKIIYRKTEEIYPTAYRLYFKKSGDTWKLFDFTLI